MNSLENEIGNILVDCEGHSQKDLVKELQAFITTHEQQARRDTIKKCMELVSTHTEHNGNYCDTGEDMEWACRSECTDMAISRLAKLLEENPSA